MCRRVSRHQWPGFPLKNPSQTARIELLFKTPWAVAQLNSPPQLQFPSRLALWNQTTPGSFSTMADLLVEFKGQPFGGTGTWVCGEIQQTFGFSLNQPEQAPLKYDGSNQNRASSEKVQSTAPFWRPPQKKERKPTAGKKPKPSPKKTRSRAPPRDPGANRSSQGEAWWIPPDGFAPYPDSGH